MQIPVLAITVFGLAASITPGPNNVMLAASGARHGLRATLPACVGVMLGFSTMVAIVGMGVGGLLAAAPTVSRVFRWVAIAWMLWSAGRVARAGTPGSGASRPPVGFLGAALLQWVNPKAWLMALGANAAFVSPTARLLPQVAAVATIFLACSVPSTLTWAVIGSAATRFLGTPWRARAFNLTMAAALVASIAPMACER